MKLFFFSILLSFITINTFAQCTLTANDDLRSEVITCLNACGCSDIIVPNGVSITLADPWDLTSEGPLTITIETGGQLVLNGQGKNVNELILDYGSVLYIEDTDPANEAITYDNGNGLVRITIGGREYKGLEFDDIISNGGADDNNPLPIALLDFYASVEKGQVVMSWITASESNNDYFTLGRSIDGRDFEVIARVEGGGTMALESKYRFVDKKPYPGLSFYRLSQTDYDGTAEVFPMVSVVYTSDKSNFSVGPSPIRDQRIKLRATGKAKNEHIRLNVFDLQGRLVEQKHFITDNYGNIQLEFRLKNQLKKGIYIFEFESGTDREYVKVLSE